MSELAEGLADDLRRVLHHLQALDKAEVEAIVASELASLAEMTGSGRLRHAAAVLRGKIGGRPAFDAESAIAEAENLYRPRAPAAQIRDLYFDQIGFFEPCTIAQLCPALCGASHSKVFEVVQSPDFVQRIAKQLKTQPPQSLHPR